MESGWCVWITGLPGSGKSVISGELLLLLTKKDIHAQLLSSDNLRKILTPKPSYSLKERDMVYAALVYIAELLTRNGVSAIIDSTGNLRRYRARAREQIPRFMEAYLDCPLKVCMKREAERRRTFHAPTHIYERAKRGEASTVPGIGQPYEPPLKPEITVDTARYSQGECAQRILRKILQLYS